MADDRNQDNLTDEQRAEIGKKGGQAAQDTGNAHELTDEERSKGGQNSSGNQPA